MTRLTLRKRGGAFPAKRHTMIKRGFRSKYTPHIGKKQLAKAAS